MIVDVDVPKEVAWYVIDLLCTNVVRRVVVDRIVYSRRPIDEVVETQQR